MSPHAINFAQLLDALLPYGGRQFNLGASAPSALRGQTPEATPRDSPPDSV